MPQETQALTTRVESRTLDLAVGAWLDAKYHKSGSVKTQHAYAATLALFRASLQHLGLDLDSDLAQVALMAAAFASFSVRGAEVTPATYNQRLAILSSFYRHAKLDNPIARLERATVHAYAGAQPLATAETRTQLHKMDRSTPTGARDYALLAVLLQTGRRLTEVASLQWQHVTVREGKATLTFVRAKGGKVMIDELPIVVTTCILTWLHLYYGKNLGVLAPDAPIWVSLSRQNYGQPLGIQSIADICEKHLGTSKVHATRHTFAHTMETAGASVSEIQARLGHESLATTGRYLAQLRQAENKHADRLADLLGIVLPAVATRLA